MRKVIPLLIILLLAGAGTAVWMHTSGGETGGLTLYGNVDQRQVELAFIDSERVAEVLVQEGAEVHPGQVLARLETRRLRDSIAVAEAQAAAADAALLRLRNGTRPEEVDQARAAVASAEADLAYAKAQHGRYTQLWRGSTGKAVSKQEFDESLLRLNVAQAALEQERQALRLAEIGPRAEDIAEAEAALRERQRELERLRNRLGDADLTSPAHSIVNRRLLEPGDMASPQRAVLSLAVLSPKWVRAYVAEPDLGRVRQGMAAQVFTDSHPGEPLTGTVGFIASVAEFTPKTVETENLRTSLVYEVRIYVNDDRDRLRLGMPATVRFQDSYSQRASGSPAPAGE